MVRVSCPYLHLYDKYKNDKNVYLKPDVTAFDFLEKLYFGKKETKIEDIFKEAKFGDKFVCRNGQIALYIGTSDIYDDLVYVCYIANIGVTHCNKNGICIYKNIELDIVSKYQETIDEEKLEMLAIEECSKILKDDTFCYELENGENVECVVLSDAEKCYIAGYKKNKG